MNREKMAQFISSLRKEKNLMQQDVAELFNVSPQAVSKWEKGDSIPDIEILEKMSSFYQVSIEELLNGERKEYIDNKNINKMEKQDLNRKSSLNLTLGISLLTCTILFFFFPFLVYSNGYISGYGIIFSSLFLTGNFFVLVNFLSYLALGVIEIYLSSNPQSNNLNKVKYLLLNASSFLTFLVMLLSLIVQENMIHLGIILFSILNITYFILNLTSKELKNQLEETNKVLGNKILCVSIVVVLILIINLPLSFTIINLIASLILVGLLLLNAFKILPNLCWYITNFLIIIGLNIFVILGNLPFYNGIIALIVFLIFIPLILKKTKSLKNKIS